MPVSFRDTPFPGCMDSRSRTPARRVRRRRCAPFPGRMDSRLLPACARMTGNDEDGGTPASADAPSHTREDVMDVKQAVQTAKEHVAHLFADAGEGWER